jgi:hypothetical protein
MVDMGDDAEVAYVVLRRHLCSKNALPERDGKASL